ncbi:MAG: hypothetical protein WB580_18955 [Candidatus Binataceae bacterium]
MKVQTKRQSPKDAGLVEMVEEFGELVLPVVGKFRTRTPDP